MDLCSTRYGSLPCFKRRLLSLGDDVTNLFSHHLGMGASASFLVTSASKTAGFGSLLNVSLSDRCVSSGLSGTLNFGPCPQIAISYFFGIVFALILSAPVSGGHLSPGFTISFVLLKGLFDSPNDSGLFLRMTLVSWSRFPCEEGFAIHNCPGEFTSFHFISLIVLVRWADFSRLQIFGGFVCRLHRFRRTSADLLC